MTVSVELHPLTFWRKHALVKVRRPLLVGEIRHSLAELDSARCAQGTRGDGISGQVAGGTGDLARPHTY